MNNDITPHPQSKLTSKLSSKLSLLALQSMSVARPPARETGRFHEYRGVLLLILGALVIWMNLGFLVPIVMGAIFACVLHPLITRMDKWRVKTSWKALLVTLLFAVSFLLPLGAIIFFGAEEGLSKIQQLQDTGVNTTNLSPNAVVQFLGLKPLIARIADISPVSEAQVRQITTRGITTAGAWLVKVLQSLLASLPGALFSMFITLLSIFFLLIDGKRAVRFIRENSIFGPTQTDRIFQVVNSLCYSVVVASVAAGVVQAAFIVLSFLITHTQGAILIGLIAFVASFLPAVGVLPVTFGLTIHALIMGDMFAAIIFAVFIVIVGIADNVVRPWVLKGGASLHPLVGFVAAFGGLDAIGFYGVFIGPVVAGIFFALLPMVTRTYRTPTIMRQP